MDGNFDFTIDELGKRNVKSPIAMSRSRGDKLADYVTDNDFIQYDTSVKPGVQHPVKKNQLLECAGPREMIYFSPSNVHSGIVT